MSSPDMTTPSSAEIFDRGYRPYDGPRNGIGTSMRSVFLNAVQRALGLRRKFRFKIVPLFAIGLAYIPAIGFLAISALLPSELAGEVVPEYAGYFGLTSISLLLFTAFVAPELLSTDRRTGMFGVYMASPLKRTHYLAAKALSLLIVLFLVTLVPVLFLLLGYSFVNLGPEGFGALVEAIVKIVVGGSVVALFYTLFGMAGATFTKRQGFAAAGIVLTAIGSAAISEILYQEAGAPDWVQLLNTGAVPIDLVFRLFDESEGQLVNISTQQSVLAFCAYLAFFASIITWGYRRLEVTK